MREASTSSEPTFPTFRLAVAFDAISPDVAARLTAAAASEPGAYWEVERCDEDALPERHFDVVVYGSLAEARRPRALRRLEDECARRGVELVRVPVTSPELAEQLPRRLRLSSVVELTPPAMRRSVIARSQRSFAFDALAGVSTVRLPPLGPTVSLRRIEGGVKLETWTASSSAAAGIAARRSLTLRWGVDSLCVEASGIAETEHAPVPRTLSLRAHGPDALTVFADAVAGDRGSPRVLLEALVRRARVWLLRALPRHARAVARAFHPEAQALVATRVATDPTGRVAQLARVCPGIFLLCSTPLFFDAPLDELCRRTIAGRTLPDAVAPVLGHWSERFGRGAAAARQFRFLKKASARVSPDALMFPLPVDLALDDVPREPDVNAAWFDSAATLASMMIGCPHDDVSRLAPFVSARGVELAELDLEARVRLLRRLHLRGHHLHRWPGRRTTLEAAQEVVKPWPDAEAHFARQITLPPTSDPLLTVRLLESAADLAREGEEMRHCLVTFDREIEAGDLVALAVNHGAERLTATVLVLDGALVLDELRGFANKRPSTAARAAVETWLERAR